MNQPIAKLRVLLIEDQRALAENIWEFLELHGQVMDHAADGQAGLQLALENAYDVIVLDLGLPRLDGIEVCRRYRAQGKATPILMLTARERLEDKLLGFEAGADDYLTKPFELRELAARVQVLHRRLQRLSPPILRVGELELDLPNRHATLRGEALALSPAGFRLLEALMRKAPHVALYEDLARALWGDADCDPARLHTHVSLLRNAIDRGRELPLIHTVHGFGYRIVPPAAT